MAKDRQVTVTIVGDSRSVEKAFKDTGTAAEGLEKKLGGFSGQVESQFKGLAGHLGPFGTALEGLGPVALAGGAAIGAMAVAVKASVSTFTNLATEIASFKRITGASAEDSSKLVAALDDVGISADTGATAFKKLAQNVDSKKFAELGIEVAKTSKGTTDLVGTFGNIIAKLDGVADPAQRANILLATMGKNAEALGPLFDRGAEGFKKMLDANAGQIFSDEDLQKTRDFKAAMDNLGDVVTDLEIKIGRNVVPALTEFAKWIQWGIDNIPTAVTGVKLLVEDLKDFAGTKFDQVEGGLQRVIDLADTLLGPNFNFSDDAFGLDSGASEPARRAATAFEELTGAVIGFVNTGAGPLNFSVGAMAAQLNGFNVALGSLGTTVGSSLTPILDAAKGGTDALTVATKTYTDVTKQAYGAVAEAIKRQQDQISSQQRAIAVEKQIADAKERVRDAEVNGARAIRDAQERLNETRAKAAGLAKAVADAEGDLTKAQATAAEATKTRQEAEDQLWHLMDRLPVSIEAVAKAEEGLKRAREESVNAAKRVLDAQKDLQEAQEDLTDLTAHGAERADRALARARRDLELSTLDLGAKEVELNEARANPGIHPAELRRLEIGVEEARDRVADATDKVAESEKKRNGLQDDIADKTQTVAEKAADLKTAQDDVATATDKVQTAENTLNTERLGRFKTDEDHKKVINDIKAARDKEAAAVEDVTSKEDALAKARQAQAQLPKDIKKAEEALADATKTASDTRKNAVESVTAAYQAQAAYLLSEDYKKAIDASKGIGAPDTSDTPTPKSYPSRAGSVAAGSTAPTGSRSGGSRSWRNNNPGNINYGDFARAHGATGVEPGPGGRFAVFPSYAAGRAALEALITGSGYRNMTIGAAINKYAPPGDNNDPVAYAAALAKRVGVSTGTRISSLNSAQITKLLDAIQAIEGWRPGTQKFSSGGFDPSITEAIDPLTDIEKAALDALKANGRSDAAAAREWRDALNRNGGNTEAALNDLGIDVSRYLREGFSGTEDDLEMLRQAYEDSDLGSGSFADSVNLFALAVAAFAASGGGGGGGGSGGGGLGAPIVRDAPGGGWTTEYPGTGGGPTIVLPIKWPTDQTGPRPGDPAGWMPALADGGYVAPRPGGTIVRLAEAGQGEYVIPKSKMGGGGGVTVHIEVHGSVVTENDLVRSVTRKMVELKDRGHFGPWN